MSVFGVILICIFPYLDWITPNTDIFYALQSLDLQILGKNRLKYLTNLLIGYLNINSLRNKITDVREVFAKLSLDYFVISETKFDESFPSSQFNISNYEIKNWRDRDKNGSGLIEFVRKGFITKRLKYETRDTNLWNHLLWVYSI